MFCTNHGELVAPPQPFHQFGFLLKQLRLLLGILVAMAVRYRLTNIVQLLLDSFLKIVEDFGPSIPSAFASAIRVAGLGTQVRAWTFADNPAGFEFRILHDMQLFCCPWILLPSLLSWRVFPDGLFGFTLRVPQQIGSTVPAIAIVA